MCTGMSSATAHLHPCLSYTDRVLKEQTNKAERARPPYAGGRLRQRRVSLKLSVRELARRLSLSPSLISQIERGKACPSVGTLYAWTTELNVSMDALFAENGDEQTAAGNGRSAFAAIPARKNGGGPVVDGPDAVVHPHERVRIQLASGVRWDRLTRSTDPNVEHFYVVYEPGGASCDPNALMRHPGHEYGYVLSGRLEVTLGFDTNVLGPDDAISFDSTIPHRLATIGEEPVHAIWFAVGRQGDSRVS
jgi:transcriptional regulator with XRE-family HTH domain